MPSFKILDFCNRLVGDYASIEEVSLSSSGLAITARLNGSSDTFSVRAEGLEFSDDGTKVAITGLSSGMPWLENVLRDFVEGEKFDVPEAARDMLPSMQAGS